MITLDSLIKKYYNEYNIISLVNLDDWFGHDPNERAEWLGNQIKKLYQPAFNDNDRILFVLSQSDEYANEDSPAGLILTALHNCLNQVDISNFFCIVITAESEHTRCAERYLHKHNIVDVPVTYEYYPAEPKKKKISSTRSNLGYNYNSIRPLKISVQDLTARQQELLLNSKSFCIYPWIHMYVDPSGTVHPCCGSIYKQEFSLGHTTKTSLKEIWNDQPMKDLRLSMLNNESSDRCARCYEQERAGFFSMRNSANKHHGHHINLVDQTDSTGHVDQFRMLYWDVRFSNLCNLRCRSCGPMFSSSWYQDQLKLAPDYANNNKALVFAGKFETDLWEQLIEHIDHVEQVYFAGGEPIMMDEHYRILEELERRKKFDVRLIYNTNFTQIKLKDRTVFDYWKKFDSVAVGASLDAMGPRGEYIRKGTVWNEVEYNRQLMLEICPNVDFYISATLSILNALHLPDFHQEWVNKGFIKPSDFNINLLTDPMHYRLDIATTEYKQVIKDRYQEHIAWLSPQDQLRRATNGFQSAVNFMSATDNTHLLENFWAKTDLLDQIRNENILEVIPELKDLK